ncbi:hypothetical protein, partial [Caminibacter pacificus]
MNGYIVGALLATTLLSVTAIESVVANQKKTEELKAVVSTAQNINELQNRMVAQSNFYKLPLTHPENLEVSKLAINATAHDRLLLNKLQAAMAIAVDKYNNEHPSCALLARTGKITLNECKEITSKNLDFVKIEDGAFVVETKDPETADKIVNVISHTTNVAEVDKKTKSVKTADVEVAQKAYAAKQIAKATADIKRHMSELTPEELEAQLNRIVKAGKDAPETAKKAIDDIKNLVVSGNWENLKPIINEKANELLANTAALNSVSSPIIDSKPLPDTKEGEYVPLPIEKAPIESISIDNKFPTTPNTSVEDSGGVNTIQPIEKAPIESISIDNKFPTTPNTSVEDSGGVNT